MDPNFEENTRVAIGKIKQAIGGGTTDLNGLNTTNKTSIVSAINEVNDKPISQQIFTRTYGVSPNKVTIQYTKDEFDNETILNTLIT